MIGSEVTKLTIFPQLNVDLFKNDKYMQITIKSYVKLNRNHVEFLVPVCIESSKIAFVFRSQLDINKFFTDCYSKFFESVLSISEHFQFNPNDVIILNQNETN